MDQITLTIDGQKITTQKGDSALETALAAGIYIPHLCHDPDLKPYGACPPPAPSRLLGAWW